VSEPKIGVFSGWQGGVAHEVEVESSVLA
jgi:hypothetical protein